MRKLIAASFLVAVFMLVASKARAQTPTEEDAAVHRMVDTILKRGEGHVGDVMTSTWVPPLPEDLAEVRTMGKAAIRGLGQKIGSPIPFRQLLAARLLEEIGGPEIVPILKEGL